jgi:hypothetical protein
MIQEKTKGKKLSEKKNEREAILPKGSNVQETELDDSLDYVDYYSKKEVAFKDWWKKVQKRKRN